eukprot:scaffold175806_cov22-Prasinocladus_malaysianus.AAC.2
MGGLGPTLHTNHRRNVVRCGAGALCQPLDTKNWKFTPECNCCYSDLLYTAYRSLMSQASARGFSVRGRIVDALAR